MILTKYNYASQAQHMKLKHTLISEFKKYMIVNIKYIVL